MPLSLAVVVDVAELPERTAMVVGGEHIVTLPSHWSSGVTRFLGTRGKSNKVRLPFGDGRPCDPNWRGTGGKLKCCAKCNEISNAYN